MTVYQIYVDGCSKGLDDRFKMRSKKIYTHIPYQSEVKEFLDKCSDDDYLLSLDTNLPYTIKFLELELMK